MANNGHVVIGIDGDASGFEKELNTAQKSAKAAAAALGHEYAKAGMSLQDGMRKAWAEVNRAQKNGTTVTIKGVETIISKNEQLVSQKNDLGRVYDDIGASSRKAALSVKAGLADIKAGVDMAVAAARALSGVVTSGVQYTANIERLQTSFEIMTGSAEKAAEVVNRLRTMGAETPFETADLANVTQLLMQYGFTADDALDKMRMLGDIAQGNSEAMTSIAMGYAQMSSAGKVNLQDIKQMINGGFNPLQEISERTGESMASLYDRISKGTMSVDEITESMRRATSEGGKFFQSMEKQSQTLNGQLSTLKDNADQLLGSLTEGLSNDLRDDLLPLANNMISTLQEAFDKDGMGGLMEAATGMVPDLLNMMTGRIEDSLASLSKFAPKAVTSIMRGIPAAIRSGSSVLPQITSALFDVAGLVVSELVSMLPELVPQVLTGFGNTFNEALKGTFKIITGFYTGIEQALHQGQTKVMGMWVDNEKIAKYDFSIDLDVDPSNAYQEIEDAYGELRTALSTDLLTPEQRNEILGMIGDDYDAVYEKLTSFGLSSGDAKTIADAVSTTNKALNNVLSRLDVSVPTETILQWFEEARGSRLYLIEAMKRAGVSESDINQITEVYDGMLGRVVNNTPSIVQEIYDKLSDGQPDDELTVASLRSNIEEYINSLLTQLDLAYEAKEGELDASDPEYGKKVSELQAWYNETKAAIMSMNSELVTLVETYAGAPTTVVQSRLEEIAALERRVLELDVAIQEASEKATTEAENAFKVVRSGAKADEATISMAISFKATQYSVDTQSAEDTYNAAMKELNELFASGDISKEEFNLQAGENAAELESSKAAAQAAYEQALREIFGGIAESEGTMAAIEEAGAKLDLSNALMAAVEALKDKDGLYENALGEEFTNILAEHLQITPDILNARSAEIVRGIIKSWAEDLFFETEESFKNVESDGLATAYQAALQEGLLAGTAFDTTAVDEQFAAILGTSMTAGAELAAPQAEAAGGSMVSSAGDGAANSGATGGSLGKDFGQGYINGISSYVATAYARAKSLAQAAERGVKDGQKSSSPSKIARGLGGDFGEGYSIGLQESMARAAEVARRMTGGIATAADITQSMRINMPNLQQEIMLANEQNPVRLYVNGRELGQVTAADNNRAQNAYRRSIALGVGK